MEELLGQRRQLLSALRAAQQQHTKNRRDLEQGGCIPAHFTTLTTAIYHWADLAAVLEEYERRTTALRQGRRDPPEPGEVLLLHQEHLQERLWHPLPGTRRECQIL